jgi:hypothetical protein
MQNQQIIQTTFEGCETNEIWYFHGLLSAIYNIPLAVADWDDVVRLTELANYYGMLRTFSTSLSATILGHHELREILPGNAFKVVFCAVKLRSPALFSDCATFCLGPINDPQYLKIQDIDLMRAIDKIYLRLTAKIRRVQERITAYLPRCSHDEAKSLPVQFRSMWHKIESDDRLEIFEDILDSRVQLVPGALANQGDFLDSFLSTEITIGDIPWDVIKMDW